MNDKRNSPRVRTLITFSALIMLLFCVFVAYQASKAYENAIIEGGKKAERLSNILADQIELSFLTVDLTLRRAVERQYFNALFGGNLPEDIRVNFRMWVDETPQIAAMMMVNEEGMVEVAASKAGYDGWFDYSQNIANQAAFNFMRNASDRPYYIGRNVVVDNRYPNLIFMSRKLTNIDGSFGGIILAAIDAQRFVEFFDSIDNGNNRMHRFMVLLLNDGNILYQSDARRVKSSKKILTFMQNELTLNADDNSADVQTISLQEEIKIYAYRQLKNIPVTAAIIIDEEDFLASWRDARYKDISFLAIFTIFGSVLSFFALTMAKQIVRVEESEQAAIMASQAKSEFLANMSHELRTPLNAIIGFSEMMQAGYFGKMNSKQSERVHDIHLCGSHLLQLISDILEFSKGEAGRLELDEENVHIQNILEECMRMMREKGKNKDITITISTEEALPALFADKRKVTQILLNLISNSIKFTPEGGQIRLHAQRDKHDGIVLSVSDTGVGIAEDKIAIALSVFGQVHRAHSQEGTGLGLPLCKMFAELHGGSLVLSSVENEGTTVSVFFPKERVISEKETKVEALSA